MKLKQKIKKKSNEAKKKRDKRGRIAEAEGRLPGVNGRPLVVDKEVGDIIEKQISKDASQGIFHDMKWILEMVFL